MTPTSTLFNSSCILCYCRVIADLERAESMSPVMAEALSRVVVVTMVVMMVVTVKSSVLLLSRHGR